MTRDVQWTTAAGARMRLRSVRLVSLVVRSVCAVAYELEALDAPVLVAVSSDLVVNTTTSAGRRGFRRPGAQLPAPRAR